MNSAISKLSLAKYYFDFLKNLNKESKIDLISKLSQSLLENKNESKNSIQSLFGAYKSEESAEEIISSIKFSRTQNRDKNQF